MTTRILIGDVLDGLQWEQRLFNVNGSYWRFLGVLAAWSVLAGTMLQIGDWLWE